jgi:hypothetical protein
MSTPPAGLFEGRNFMTPDIVAYFNLGDGVWAELSTGTGMSRQPIFGVTIRPDPGNKRSKMFQSRAQAMRYINTQED